MRNTFFAFVASTMLVDVALAGAPVPLPIAGATGPIGLAIAIAGYVAYRLFQARK